MKKREAKILKESTHTLVYTVLFIALLSLVIVSVANSLFFKHPDRINVVFYGEKTALYSWGKTNGVNYFLPMYSDLKILVPGGYGYYRVGALGKLISLEKKPELLTRAFSSTVSNFVNYYFYPKGNSIYYGKTPAPIVYFPSFYQIWFSPSNTSFIDKFYFWLIFTFAKRSDFISLETYPTKSLGQEILLDEENFAKRYQGLFYYKTYRDEKRVVQIIYTKEYDSAVTVSRILEGVGIRVVDISQQNKQPKVCAIYEGETSFSQTAQDLSRFFHCKLVKGKTGVSDIILELADVEALWRNK